MIEWLYESTTLDLMPQITIHNYALLGIILVAGFLAAIIPMIIPIDRGM